MSDSLPTPITREDIYLDAALGLYSGKLPSPITRADKYLATLGRVYSGDLPAPITRKEKYLALLVENSSESGGVSVCGRNLIGDSDWEINYTCNSHGTTHSIELLSGYDISTFIGKTLTFSYFLRRGGTYINTSPQSGTANRFGTHGVTIWKNSETGDTLTKYPFAEYLTAESDGERVAMKYAVTPPAGYDTLISFSFSLQLFSYPDEDNDTCPTWTLARPKLEVGDAATPWSPAPEDGELPTPITRTDKYLAYLCGVYDGDLPTPITRTDRFLYHLATEGAVDAYTIIKYEGSAVYVQKIAVGETDYTIDYAGKAGYLFAGWYTDEDYTTAADFSEITGDMTVYARYVSDDYLKLKLATVSTSGVMTAIRSVAAVDGKNYAEVGFDYEYSDGTTSTVEVTTYSTSLSGSTAKKLYGGDVASSAKLIYKDLKVSSIEAGTEITITAYWVTMDGTRVTGTSKVVTYTGDGIVVTAKE